MTAAPEAGTAEGAEAGAEAEEAVAGKKGRAEGDREEGEGVVAAAATSPPPCSRSRDCLFRWSLPLCTLLASAAAAA